MAVSERMTAPAGRRPAVVAWVSAHPSVRVMARATAEAAERAAELRVLSAGPPPPQWPSWCAAANDLGVTASWTVVAGASRCQGVPRSLLSEVAPACLVVTAAESLRGGSGPSVAASALARLTDVYVVAGGERTGRSPTRAPAVVVGVPDVPDQGHLLAVAAREAELRHRNLVILHARSQSLAGLDHTLEHRWLDAVAVAEVPTTSPVPPRVVVTRRSVVDALRDHVDTEDVLVVGVHAPDRAKGDHLTPLLAAPPCDLLLTSTAVSARTHLPLRPVSLRLATGDPV